MGWSDLKNVDVSDFKLHSLTCMKMTVHLKEDVGIIFFPEIHRGMLLVAGVLIPSDARHLWHCIVKLGDGQEIFLAGPKLTETHQTRRAQADPYIRRTYKQGVSSSPNGRCDPATLYVPGSVRESQLGGIIESPVEPRMRVKQELQLCHQPRALSRILLHVRVGQR